MSRNEIPWRDISNTWNDLVDDDLQVLEGLQRSQNEYEQLQAEVTMLVQIADSLLAPPLPRRAHRRNSRIDDYGRTDVTRARVRKEISTLLLVDRQQQDEEVVCKAIDRLSELVEDQTDLKQLVIGVTSPIWFLARMDAMVQSSLVQWKGCRFFNICYLVDKDPNRKDDAGYDAMLIFKEAALQTAVNAILKHIDDASTVLHGLKLIGNILIYFYKLLEDTEEEEDDTTTTTNTSGGGVCSSYINETITAAVDRFVNDAEMNGIGMTIDVMEAHPTDMSIQRNACILLSAMIGLSFRNNERRYEYELSQAAVPVIAAMSSYFDDDHVLTTSATEFLNVYNGV